MGLWVPMVEEFPFHPWAGVVPRAVGMERRERVLDSGLSPPLAVCQILPKGVVSVLGPSSSPASASTVSHICGEKEVRQGVERSRVGVPGR